MSDLISKKLWEGVSCNTVSISKCKPNKAAMEDIEKIINNDETIKTHIHDLLNVYYDIATCGVSHQCERAMICTAFYPEIQGFYTKYYGYLQTFDDRWNIGKIFQIGHFLDMCDAEKSRAGS